MTSSYEGEDRRVSDEPSRLDAVVDLLSQATKGAADLSTKIDSLVATRTKMLTMQKWVIGGMLAVLVSTLASIIGVLETKENTQANRTNSRFLIECLTPSPAPGVKPLYKGDEVHECFDKRGTEAQKLVLQVSDANGDSKIDHDEIVAKQDELLKILASEPQP